jgi:hypothetical protein
VLPLPPVISFTLAAIGAAALAKLLAREWRRVNAQLDAQAAEAMARETLPTLRRDPQTGIYRPD